jgi:nucleotide-binding universal stress UspA family protein
MEVKKILWPTDFSKSAEQALPQVKSLIDKYGCEVHVLYVVEDIANHESWYGEFDRPRVEQLVDWATKTAHKRLAQICEKYLEGCPLYIKHVAVGDPAHEILRFIREEGADMVVMATQGQKGNFQFGSVAEKVVKNSTVPVITVPVAPGTKAPAP